MSESLTAKAYLKELRLASRKTALVAGLVRNRTVDDALVILSHTPKRAAKPLAKLISSARANAINNFDMKAGSLVIDTISVTAGARIKRYRPVARGMAHPYQKKTSNVLVIVRGEAKPAKKAEASKDAKAEEKESK